MFDCTTLITTSPVTSHPSTEHIDNVITSVRSYMPDDLILILCDGQSTPQYEEYKKRLEAKCANEWQNVKMMQFSKPSQQASMARKALESVTSKYIFFCEHDAYPLGDIPIDKIFGTLDCSDVDLVRLFHYHVVHPDHYFMYGDVDNTHPIPLIKTVQFSSRTYFAKTEWYRWLINGFFHPDDFVFIEEKLEPITRLGGWGEWQRWKMWVYAPSGGDFCRSGHSYARKA